jgi:hypothetical protein
MVKKLLSFSLIGVVSACFGDGPVPTPPSRATVLVTGSPIQSCGATGMYFGPVAIGAGSGYISMLPFTAQGGGNGDCNGGGGSPPPTPETVVAFDEDTGAQSPVGSAGQDNQNIHAHLTTTPAGVAYAYSTGTNQVMVAPANVMVGSGQGGTASVLGIAQAGSDLYVEVTNGATTGGPPEPDNPGYPCCGPIGNTAGTQANIYKIAGSTATSVTQVAPIYTTLDTSFVGNANNLAFFESGTAGVLWQLTLLATSSLTKTPITSLSSGGEVPVGLDANDSTIAFSTSLACVIQNQSDVCSVDECNVFAYDIAGGTMKTLLSTNQFGCMDAKLADGYVYFTIVDYSSRTESLFGKGIGRVAIADKSFDSLALGVQGPAAGPRRIYPSAGKLYLVDPLVLVRIDAAELDGKHDFTP